MHISIVAILATFPNKNMRTVCDDAMLDIYISLGTPYAAVTLKGPRLIVRNDWVPRLLGTRLADHGKTVQSQSNS
ncbi:uncharacterized protein N7479_007803 [Penicillium vulpinum]|uniref:uncharacterized protein n=1 Tax=Penicillium vulpinum TaxID=29845 RepID=UPI0025492F37|nr:uncharacterized protein N7479_007803 [Penicillium vulpinum]KAJ5960653.1 hypothetical protein N7479_007803 [Penicillium vulpinum]